MDLTQSEKRIPSGVKSFVCLTCEKVDFHGGFVVYDEDPHSLVQFLFDGSIKAELTDIYAGDGCAVVFSDRDGNEIFRKTVFLRCGICAVFGAKMIVSDDACHFTFIIRNMAEEWNTTYQAEWEYAHNA